MGEMRNERWERPRDAGLKNIKEGEWAAIFLVPGDSFNRCQKSCFWFRCMLSPGTKSSFLHWSQAVVPTGADSQPFVPDCATTRYQKLSLGALSHRSKLKVPTAIAAGILGWTDDLVFF